MPLGSRCSCISFKGFICHIIIMEWILERVSVNPVGMSSSVTTVGNRSGSDSLLAAVRTSRWAGLSTDTGNGALLTIDIYRKLDDIDCSEICQLCRHFGTVEPLPADRNSHAVTRPQHCAAFGCKNRRTLESPQEGITFHK